VSVHETHAERRHSVRRVLVWVLLANLVVIVAKLAVGLRSGSIAILGDAAHSGVDVINNVVGLLAVRLAANPPDAEHPYGHGKFETMGGVAVVAFLSITFFSLIEGAIGRLAGGAPPPSFDPFMFGVMAATMVVNVLVARTEARYGHKLDSEMLQADARHTAADVWVTAAVLVGMVLVELGWGEADSVLAIAVALVIAYSGFQILRSTVPVLVDHRVMDPELVFDLARGVDGVAAVSAIRSRGRPGEAFVELTIHVAPELTVVGGHAIADRVERRLESQHRVADVVVHVEPLRAEGEEDQSGSASNRQLQ